MINPRPFFDKNIVCKNPKCFDFGNVRPQNVELMPEEEIYCSFCYEPVEETMQPVGHPDRLFPDLELLPPAERWESYGKPFPRGGERARAKQALKAQQANQ